MTIAVVAGRPNLMQPTLLGGAAESLFARPTTRLNSGRRVREIASSASSVTQMMGLRQAPT